MSALRDVLRQQVMKRLYEAWDTEGVGTLDVGRHYVQWAKYSDGLQVECVSNAFLQGDERLGFVQRRKLDVLGFRRPDLRSPNHYVLFASQAELPAAADLLMRAIEEVLDVEVLEQDLPEQGNVCFVVPVGKCFPEAISAVAEPMIAASQARCPTVVIDAHGVLSGEGRERLSVERWLLADDADEFPQLLSLRFAHGGVGQLLTQAASLARACERLCARGAHVIVIGPMYLPDALWLYNGVVAGLADGLVAVASAQELRGWGRSLKKLFASHIRYTALAGYGPDKVFLEGARWSFSIDEEGGGRFHQETAAALGLHGIADGLTDHPPFA